MSDDQILLERNPSPMKLDVIGVYEWPIWRKEASTFDWTYAQQETCYVLRGRFSVTPKGGEPQHFKSIFMDGFKRMDIAFEQRADQGKDIEGG